MSACAACGGAGRIVGYACPGFVRIEAACRPCGGTGTAPTWQAEAIRRGQALRAARLGRDMSLWEEARCLGVSPVALSEAETGARPVGEWPQALQQGLFEGTP